MSKFLLSPLVYTHRLHSHWLKYVNTKGSLNSLLAFDKKLMNGRGMSKANTDWYESEKSNELTHKLDLVSGSYIKVLEPYARKIIKSQLEENEIPYDQLDLKYTVNFSSEADNTPESRLSGEFYENGHYYFDSDQGMIEVGFAEVEAFAYKERDEQEALEA